MGIVERALEALAELAGQPATSYYEAAVSRTIQAFLHRANVPFFVDEYGNVIARRVGQRKASGGPAIALVAHMEHPGFELTESGQLRAKARMLGRTSDAVYAGRVPLRVFQPLDTQRGTKAWITAGQLTDRTVELELDSPVELPAFAVFDLPEFRIVDGVVHMRACDDLAGCAVILAVMEALGFSDAASDVYAVFTRAEEEGLIGARLIAAAKILPQDTLVVSVESSRALPGAVHGAGPIIRVGDAAVTFSAEAEAILLAAQRRLAERVPPVSVQRQLMSGGVCEASAFVLNGYRATGIAFPLGHYHNGLGEARVEAEFIHVSDFTGGAELLYEAASAEPAVEPPVYARLRAHPESEAVRLRDSTPGV